MRRIAFALVLLIDSGMVAPAQAQWWGDGWERPCFGACRSWVEDGGDEQARPRRFIVPDHAPRPGWGSPAAFGPPRFHAGEGSWPGRWERRERRWHRFASWRRWADAAREAAQPEAERQRLGRRIRRRPSLPERAIATRPTSPRAESVRSTISHGGQDLAPPRLQSSFRPEMPAAATTSSQPPRRSFEPAAPLAADDRTSALLPRPPNATARRPSAPSAVRRIVQPAALRDGPEVQPTTAPAVPAPAAPARASTSDVPVAPLE